MIRRIFLKESNVFADVSEEKIKEKLYPPIKKWFEKYKEKRVERREGKIGIAGMDCFLADLYGITPDSKIILRSPDVSIAMRFDVEIEPLSSWATVGGYYTGRPRALILSLHPEDAKVLFGWSDNSLKLKQFNIESYITTNYIIERVIPAPEFFRSNERLSYRPFKRLKSP